MRSNGIALTLILTACVGIGRYDAAEQNPPNTSCLITAVGGDLQGVNNGASCSFLGVPFAAPPLGELRWRPPQPAAPWMPAVLSATTQPAVCPNILTGTPTGSEDCLKLNLWMPNPIPKRAPVIVWLHPGGFSAASANFPSNNGRRLAEETGAIVVVPNYRHGPFGFLAHPAFVADDPAYGSTGNYGLLDQQAALAWVRDNIAHFGGNRWNVTVAGTSAGGQSVGMHLVSPGAANLFRQAIVQSAFPTLRMPTVADVEGQANAFATALACTDPATVVACLRSKTRDQVLRALPIAMEQVTEPPGRVHWRPVVDGLVVPDQPRVLFERGSFHRVPLIVGANRDEGWGNFITRSFPTGVDAPQYESWLISEFGDLAPDVSAAYPVGAFGSAVEAMARVTGDAQFVCEARRLGRLAAGHQVPAYLYSYEYEIDDLSVDHVIHGVETNILFGNNYVPTQFPNHVLDASDLALHAVMSGYWFSFAATGSPNWKRGSLPIEWPVVKGPGKPVSPHLVFDRETRLALSQQGQCDLWDAQFLRPLTLDVPAGRP